LGLFRHWRRERFRKRGGTRECYGLPDWGGGPAEPFEGTDSGLEFSVPRGIYDAPFDLTISHASATHVRYSLDSSDPRTSPTVLEAELPLVLRADPSDTANRYLAPTHIVRATVGDATALPETVTTRSYLFIDRVVELSPDQEPPGDDWPESGGGDDTQMMDYGMDPDVTSSSAYAGLMSDSLRALPSLSLVTDLGNLFDPEQGIYVNAMEEGEEWGRFGSIELLTLDGSPGFQANAGIRIRGGASRGPHNPKHAFRLFFRGDHGTPKLEFPLFEGEGTARFDKVNLRTTQNYSWNMDGGGDFNLNTMNRDVFSRDLQREMGVPYTRSRYYHLYLDGVYWGLFQTEERPDAWFAETCLGGEREDYDVVKVERVVDGFLARRTPIVIQQLTDAGLY